MVGTLSRSWRFVHLPYWWLAAVVEWRGVRSIVSMNPTGRVTLPADTRRALGLEGESLFEVEIRGGAIVLKPVAVVPLDQARSLTAQRRRSA